MLKRINMFRICYILKCRHFSRASVQVATHSVDKSSLVPMGSSARALCRSVSSKPNQTSDTRKKKNQETNYNSYEICSAIKKISSARNAADAVVSRKVACAKRKRRNIKTTGGKGLHLHRLVFQSAPYVPFAMTYTPCW